MALVYVTDDEPNICKLVAFGLKDEGFETATFTDGLYWKQFKRENRTLSF